MSLRRRAMSGRLGIRDPRVRCLPQGCQIDTPYSQEEWQCFLECAIEGFDSGEGLSPDFPTKIARHNLSDERVREALLPSAMLVAYEHDGSGKVALWSRDKKRGGMFVIARVSDGLIFNAFPLDNIKAYVGSLRNARWLRR
jgi:hypothetical protein